MSVRGLASRLKALAAKSARKQWLVIVMPAEGGYGAHEPGSITFWPDGSGCTMVVPTEYQANPVDGLSDEQKHVLQHGDHLDVHSLRRLEDGGVEVGGEGSWNGVGLDPIPAPERKYIDEPDRIIAADAELARHGRAPTRDPEPDQGVAGMAEDQDEAAWT